jgi:hypothetical protein
MNQQFGSGGRCHGHCATLVGSRGCSQLTGSDGQSVSLPSLRPACLFLLVGRPAFSKVKNVTDQEREEILEQARRNLDPVQRRIEQTELARRVMSLPGSDPVATWKAEGEAVDVARAEAKQEREAEAATAAFISATEWCAWVTERIKEERAFILEVCGQAIGELTQDLHRDFEAKISELAHQSAVHREQSAAMGKLHIRELAQALTRTAALERQVDQLNAALNMKRTDGKIEAVRNGLSDDIEKARRDIADLKLKLN